jgi:hypothetical protein
MCDEEDKINFRSECYLAAAVSGTLTLLFAVIWMAWHFLSEII